MDACVYSLPQQQRRQQQWWAAAAAATVVAAAAATAAAAAQLARVAVGTLAAPRGAETGQDGSAARCTNGGRHGGQRGLLECAGTAS